METGSIRRYSYGRSFFHDEGHRAWCSCGWRSDEVEDDEAANRALFDHLMETGHAQGREPESV